MAPRGVGAVVGSADLGGAVPHGVRTGHGRAADTPRAVPSPLAQAALPVAAVHIPAGRSGCVYKSIN